MTEKTNATLTTPSPVPARPQSPLLKIEPASEWANSTLHALDSEEILEHATVATPGPQLPGAYPFTPSTAQPPPSLEEVKETAKEYIQAASQYVPSQDDIRKVAQSATGIVTGYMPTGVATYLGSPQPQLQESTSFSPIEENETTPTTGGGFILLNRGNNPANGHTPGHEENATDAGNDASNQPGVNHTPNTDAHGLILHAGLVGNQTLSTDSSKTPPDSHTDALNQSGTNSDTSTHGSTHYAGIRGDQTILTDDASTVTQPGSRALSVQGDGSLTTSYSISAGVMGRDNQNSPSHGHISIKGDLHPKIQGHSNGVVNRSGIMLEAGPSDTRVVNSSGSGGVGLGSGSGPAGEQDKNSSNSGRDSSNTTDKDNQTILLPTMINPSKDVAVNSSTEMNTPKTRNTISNTGSPQEVTPDVLQKENRITTQQEARQSNDKLDFLKPNTTPRTHPLGKEGANWKGVPFGESYQAALDRDEERGPNVGKEVKPAIKKANGGSLLKKIKSPKSPAMEPEHSHMATDGHERTTSNDTRLRFQEELHSSQQSSVQTTSSNLHDPVGPKATATMAEISEEQPSSRRKSRFMSKIKAWSKKLSQHEKKTTVT